MNVYLIRHGESVGNASDKHQTAETPLSELGLQQAQRVANRLQGRAFQVLLASPYRRAQQTAEKISQAIDLPIEMVPQLHELKRPSEIEGQVHTDPEVERIKKIIAEHKDNPKWHYSDEENPHDVLARAKEVLAYFQARAETEIVAVTHGNLLRALVATAVFEDQVEISHLKLLKRKMPHSNTGITQLHWHDEKGWQVTTYNDQAHL